MRIGNVVLGLFLALSVGFLASALLYSPQGEHAPKTPGEIQSYCAGKMSDKPVILCAGNWTLDEESQCIFKCGTEEQAQQNAPSPGGDSDEQGGKCSAGYSWCEAKHKCIRMQEEECMCAGIAGFACPIGYGCNMSAGYPDASGTCVPDN
ncbi:MAG: hypothetical protein WAX07_08435 [Candidatus Altiarchaeia archaeon]